MSDPLISLEQWPFDFIPFKSVYNMLVSNPITSVSELSSSSSSSPGSEQHQDPTLIFENRSTAQELIEYAQQNPHVTRICIDFDFWMKTADNRHLSVLNLLLSEPRPWTVTFDRGFAFLMDSLVNRFENFELDDEVNDILVEHRWTNSISQLQLYGPMKYSERLSGAMTPFLSHRLKGLYLHRFDIDSWSYDQDYEVDPDAFVSTIQTLSLSSCTIRVDPLLQILQEANQLRSLSLMSCSLDDSRLQRIIEVLHHRPPEIGLHHLDLNGNRFCLEEEETFQTIARFLSDPSCTLKVLNLRGFECLPPMGGGTRENFLQSLWEALSTNNSIRQLGLASLNLQDWDIERLYQALGTNKTLSILRMDNNPDITIQGWSRLRERLKGVNPRATLDAIFYQTYKTEEETMNQDFPEKKAVFNSIRSISLTNVLLGRLCRSFMDAPGGSDEETSNDEALPPLGLYPHILEKVSVAKSKEEEEKSPPILYELLFHVVQHLLGR
eukprot:Nitzschia sp. Nitz4//scaffold184_size43902//10796//12283//NITZ4_007279-RA/size43902-processed-gene-0.2-mRNA-1//1//CDS//3329539642//303//frame0